ncbi:hypothetical protein [Bartonella australis]|uniref:hypothetical protein n=1 Tax=Bartonella australis TaxID=388640 RepID=UPI0016517EA3|nr:hypothetical protein [Bartonella australis]
MGPNLGLCPGPVPVCPELASRLGPHLEPNPTHYMGLDLELITAPTLIPYMDMMDIMDITDSMGTESETEPHIELHPWLGMEL